MTSISNQRVVYPGENGIACFLIPSPECGLTIEEIAEKDVPANTPYRIVTTAEFPQDILFRDAWTFNEDEEEPVFSIDMPKARDIHRNYIRAARKPLLEQLDIDFMQALEAATSTTEIVATKQALRDAPADPAITAAQDLTDLKAQWDTELLGASPYLA